MRRFFFSRPATTRSMASMKSAITTLSRSLRAARSAASLTTLARSAPANPGVRVVPAEDARVAALADRVELVDEDDRGRLRRRLLEEVAHARGSDADEHLDELGTREREERNAGLARDGARQERLACSGRTDEQHSLRDASTQAPELRGRLEELDDLLQLVDRLVDAGDVLEGDSG